MKNKLFYRLGLWLPVFALFLSCNTLDPVPTDNFTDLTFWRSAANAETMVNMAYNQMYSANKMWNDEALSDNVFEGRTNTDARTIRSGIANASLAVFRGEWADAYGALKTCHVLLGNIDRVEDASLQWKQQRKAEVRFIRAFIYFRLVNFFGDVPFFTQDISLEEAHLLKRTPAAVVRQFIHDELADIGLHLPNRDQLPAVDNGRITKGAAVAFQARVYLYENNWTKVVDYCDSLISYPHVYGSYALFPSYGGLFEAANEYNAEVILDYGYVPNDRTWSKFYDMAPLSAGARLNAYAPVQSLVDSYLTLRGLTIADDPAYNDNNPYVNRDPRLAATLVFHAAEWTDFNGSKRTIYIRPGTGSTSDERKDIYNGPSANTTATGYYTRKYYDKTATATFDAGLNIIMFRYADVLLMLAEAKHELGQMDAEVWNKTIRVIRQRAGFTAAEALNFPTGLTAAALQQVIRNERRSELALEGLRYYDIKRWKAGKTYLEGKVLGAKFVNGNSQYIELDSRRFDENRDYLWSVPRTELDLNKNLLPNNPGYEN
ncbi:RagB/SusD family nutrient uptake outer membrane protein [Sphingobacterium sp. Mn56C]|uniref:RagB/SusD family nutrient uptake outer membrane protein n=1 Tax=Sphingobacterium sp. Mn56C TaxID=3395261 RepID=UPI003BBF930F